MSHLTREQSRALGRKRELFHFFRGTEDWRYTSYRTRIAFFGELWEPLPITHGDIELGSEDRPGAVDVTVPTESDIGLILQAGNSTSPISLRIYEYHQGVVDDYAIVFNGEVQGADIQGEQCVVQAMPLQGRMNVPLPRGLFQRDRCRWLTYDPLTCGVDPAPFTFASTVSAINGLKVTVTGAAAFNSDPTFFSLGVFSKGAAKTGILTQTGDVMDLEFWIPGLIVGDAVVSWRGTTGSRIPATISSTTQHGDSRFLACPSRLHFPDKD